MSVVLPSPRLADTDAAGAATTAAERPYGQPEPGWLISRRTDFWMATGAASLALLVILAVLHFRGDRELDWVDFIFAELHVGATYDAIVRRRLWKHMPVNVLVIPLLILAATFALMLGGHKYYIFTILMYFAVWHRGRQNFGVARYYQRQAGGPMSRLHDWLFTGAIYLPMLASVLFYTWAYPINYEGEPYFALSGIPKPVIYGMTGLALVWVLAYLVFTEGKTADLATVAGEGASSALSRRLYVHPAERWTVLAHAVAFGSAYVLGGWKVSFIIVLAILHEVQYLYFSYAMARRDPTRRPTEVRRELVFLGTFAILPILGLLSAMGVNKWGGPWLAPSGVGLLLCHYWLDGKIWKGPAMKLR
jgi:hypothetical protein